MQPLVRRFTRRPRAATLLTDDGLETPPTELDRPAERDRADSVGTFGWRRPSKHERAAMPKDLDAP
jgi:hypothetical protein